LVLREFPFVLIKRKCILEQYQLNISIRGF